MQVKPLVLVLFGLGLIGCSSKSEEFRSREAGIQVVIRAFPSGVGRAKTGRLAHQGFEVFHQRMELLDQNAGVIADLNSRRGPLKVSDELYQVLTELTKIQKTLGADTAACDWSPFLASAIAPLQTATEALTDSVFERISGIAAMGRETFIRLLPDNQVALEGPASLQLDRMTLGWAVDGATEAMMDGGVAVGMITAGNSRRVWGTPPPDQEWQIELPVPADDTAQYVFELRAGGYCSIELSLPGIDKNYSHLYRLFNLYPNDDVYPPIGIMGWAPSGLTAAALTEAAVVMGRRRALEACAASDSLGVILRYPKYIEIALETDPDLSSQVSVTLP